MWIITSTQRSLNLYVFAWLVLIDRNRTFFLKQKSNYLSTNKTTMLLFISFVFVMILFRTNFIFILEIPLVYISSVIVSLVTFHIKYFMNLKYVKGYLNIDMYVNLIFLCLNQLSIYHKLHEHELIKNIIYRHICWM